MIILKPFGPFSFSKTT